MCVFGIHKCAERKIMTKKIVAEKNLKNTDKSSSVRFMKMNMPRYIHSQSGENDNKIHFQSK